MKINNTPVNTTKNYNINNFLVEDNIFNINLNKFEDINCNYEIIKQKTNITNAMSNEILLTLKNANAYNKLNITKDTNDPIEIVYTLTQNLADTLTISVSEGINAEVVIKYVGTNAELHVGYIFADIQNNAKLNLTIVSDTNCPNFVHVISNLKSNTILNQTIIDFGKKYSVYRIFAENAEDNAKTYTKMAYISAKECKTDVNIIKNLYKPLNEADIYVVGALLDGAEKNFKGTINFVRGAKKSIGKEDELCLMLSDNCKSKSLPMLLCTEEDVEGSHSSATGKLDDKELFYILSRGINKADALKLMLKAKFNKVLNDLNDNLKQEIIDKIDRIIDYENQLSN